MSKERESLERLAALMRGAWDRRVDNDYRFWMSEASDSDEAMWAAGERDLNSLLEGVSSEISSQWRGLEVGCGVGRLLKGAAKRFESLVGVDVSPKAIEKASSFLCSVPNVEVQMLEGSSLSAFPEGEFDIVFSFAVLGHMPCAVFASYLSEISRVLRDGALARLQVYLGAEQSTVCEDTLSVRCYEEKRLRAGFASAGFEVEALDELVLPYDAVDKENQIYPYIAKLKKIGPVECSLEEIEKTLLSTAEPQASKDWAGSHLEYRMAVTRVHELIDAGRIEQARDTLALAVEHYKDAEPEALAILAELKKIV